MNGLKQKFGKNLQFIRKAKGYTQSQLGKMIDLQQRQVTRLERGINFPSIETIEKIAVKLNVPIKQLFDFSSREFTKNNLAITYKAIKFDDVIRLFFVSKDVNIDILKNADNKQFSFTEADKQLAKIAKKYKRPIVVEFSENAEIQRITIFFPDSSTKDIFYSINANEISPRLARLFELLRLYAEDNEKLEFLEVAIKSIDNSLARKILIDKINKSYIQKKQYQQ